VIGMVSLDLTRSGEGETLLGTGVCLYFWHCFINFKLLLIIGDYAYTGRDAFFFLTLLSR